jgi:3-hydroxy-9,10-secoandrosta-1,3,5(10)-triene-9,17-dione monooxygenase reductase component
MRSMSAGREPRFVGRDIDQREYRDVLGCYPTGVVVITAIGPDGNPAGMAVGSFTSVSIEPPLVCFYPAKASSSFPKIRDAGAFCVNILTADQEYVCRDFAIPGGDKFRRVSWSPSAVTGAPVLDGALAWLDCMIERIADAGDHLAVLARVYDLGARSGSGPLVFHRGTYGGFTTNSAPECADVNG